MNDTASIVSFQRAIAGTGPSLYLSSAFSDDLREHEKYHPNNRLWQFALPSESWLAHDLPQYITSLCLATFDGQKNEALVSLSDQGEMFVKHSQTGDVTEIFYEDPHNQALKKFKTGTSIAQISNQIYVCGYFGRVLVYQASDRWRLLTPTLVPDSDAKAKAALSATQAANYDWKAGLRVRMSKKWKNDYRLSFNKIAGLSEHEIYVAGHEGGLLFWNGHEPRWIEPTPKVSLFGMHVEPPNVWVCGSEGTILHGNAHDGFEDYSLGTDHSFNKITRFKGKIYLSANGGFGGPIGLFTYDGRNLQQVTTGLTPDIHDIHTVTAADGILWAVGYRDILCFDGQTWRRIDHPDNPPVR